jgi:putative transposase
MNTRHSEEKIRSIIKHARRFKTASAFLRKNGIPPSTFYRWKSKYFGMTAKRLHYVHDLERQVKRLTRLVSSQSNDIIMLKEINSKKL